ncbi:Uncharacterised protein [Vibrio cholerae]|nr:Uncharacterised protein [Vibrio cholerae]CSB90382.1 Uncharacterised protein [Vibrio cholerae]
MSTCFIVIADHIATFGAFNDSRVLHNGNIEFFTLFIKSFIECCRSCNHAIHSILENIRNGVVILFIYLPRDQYGRITHLLQFARN